MAADAKVKQEESYKVIRTILVSQPKPERSPYYELEKKYGLQIDWRTFIHVEPLPARDFRKFRIRLEDYTSIILTSKNAVDHFFRMCEEMRVRMSQDTKYFCLTEAVANYLQKFIVYRKRKVFVGKRAIADLKTQLLKHKEKEKFLLPCSNLGAPDVAAFLDEHKFDWKDGQMYTTVSSDLSDLSDVTYDVLVFFSPVEIQSLYDNFPDFQQRETRLAVYGHHTCKAVEERGLTANIKAPAPEAPSMTMALELYLQKSNKPVE